MGVKVRGVVRSSGGCLPPLPGGEYVRVESIGEDTSWEQALQGVDCVIHLAAMNMAGKGSSAEANALFRVNTQGTWRLAGEAARLGVRRFVFVSTIKVNGEHSEAVFHGPGSASGFSPEDPPLPSSPYAVSKWKAEQRLMAVHRAGGMDAVIIRPPLVYGPGVKGNFLRLIRLADTGCLLPLGGIDNRRSLIYVDNLTDFIWCCINHPGAAGRVFTVADKEAVSTSELLGRLAVLLGRHTRLFSVPRALMRGAALVAGMGGIADRLFDFLEVDSSAARELLGWTPPHTLDAGLEETVAWFREIQNRNG